MPPPATDFDLTEHGRRSAKLDHRFEIRKDRDHPERGRGLFAVQRVPEGTEVLRVRAVGAAVAKPFKKKLCGRCFRRAKKFDDLTPCRNCLLPLCDACHAGDAGDRPHSTRCEFGRKSLMLNPLDEGTLRLSADILARKKAGEIDDEDWGLLNSLGIDNSEDGSTGLDARELQKAVNMFKDAMDMDVSEEDIQTMHRRNNHNVYMVSPGDTSVACGDVQALFPFGALVNHSCRPNSCFHSVAESSPRGPEIELVLRTTFDLRAGDELCVAYFPDYVETPVARRREMLSDWGFHCTCARCQIEAEEEKHPEKHVKSRDQDAEKILHRIWKIVELGVRNQLQFGQEQGRTLEEALNLLSGTREEDISPMLRGRLTMMALMVARFAEGSVPSVGNLSAYQLACQHISPFRDPRVVDLFLEVHVKGVMLLREVEVTSASALMLRTVAEDALTKAIEMCELLYGKHHDYSVHLQGLKKSRGRARLPS
ncbi:unnamed protein product [Laminaria digitata]